VRGVLSIARTGLLVGSKVGRRALLADWLAGVLPTAASLVPSSERAKTPGDPAYPLSWQGDGLTQCASHVRQSPLCVLPIGCPQAWFIIPESRCPSPPNNDGSETESSECKETGPALLGRPVPSNLPPGRCLTLRRAPCGCLAHLFHRPRRPTLEPDDGRRVRADAGDRTVPRSCDGPPGVFRNADRLGR
jgi:hypothetical protein